MDSRVPVLAFGGDYNPEQWSGEIREADLVLMREAGVNLVTLGVFSWALLEPQPGSYDFGWLDEILDQVHAAGIAVDLATATASPPPWLAHRHPETLPVTAEGVRLWPGSRQGFCPSSPIYRDRAATLCRAMAERYGDHEAVVLWHVSNEIGNHNAWCYCDVSAAAFRSWLERRYGDVAGLNEAWGTTFWSQRYGSFAEVNPPRAVPAIHNPTHVLDFRRFSSDELLANFLLERDILHEVSPGVPVTTNIMVMEHVREMDYWSWASHLDVVSNDHYLVPTDVDPHVELAFCADLTRGLALGRPWLLMEHSPSAVNWQHRNIAKQPGEMLRNSLQHVARGSDSVLFFQWRASRAGAEKYHSALVPHAGTETRIWREVCELGAVLQRISEVGGSTVRHDVAMLVDWQSWWSAELDSHPTSDLRYLDRAHAHYRALWDRGVGVDFVAPGASLAGYRLIVVPTLYLTSEDTAAVIAEAADAGATVLVTYFSGIADENDHIHLGGYPGAFRDLLGVCAEEFVPLRGDERVTLDLAVGDGEAVRADQWTEHLHAREAEVVASYLDGPLAGVPALTRRAVGAGFAWYAACRLDDRGVDLLTDRLLQDAGVEPVAPTRPGVEVVRRRAEDGRSWLFVLNHTGDRVEVPARGVDLVGGGSVDGSLSIAAGAVAVVRED